MSGTNESDSHLAFPWPATAKVDCRVPVDSAAATSSPAENGTIRLVDGGARVQTRECMAEVAEVLQLAGCSFEPP